jgi:hypothetical protein
VVTHTSVSSSLVIVSHAFVPQWRSAIHPMETTTAMDDRDCGCHPSRLCE